MDGVDWTRVEFEDNEECLNLIEKVFMTLFCHPSVFQLKISLEFLLTFCLPLYTCLYLSSLVLLSQWLPKIRLSELRNLVISSICML